MQKYHHSSEQNNLLRYLYSKIRATGPITVAEYMKTVLTSPEAVCGVMDKQNVNFCSLYYVFVSCIIRI